MRRSQAGCSHGPRDLRTPGAGWGPAGGRGSKAESAKAVSTPCQGSEERLRGCCRRIVLFERTVADPPLLQARAWTVGVRRWFRARFGLGRDPATARRGEPRVADVVRRRIRFPGLEAPSPSSARPWAIGAATGGRLQQRSPHHVRLTNVRSGGCRGGYARPTMPLAARSSRRGCIAHQRPACQAKVTMELLAYLAH